MTGDHGGDINKDDGDNDEDYNNINEEKRGFLSK